MGIGPAEEPKPAVTSRSVPPAPPRLPRRGPKVDADAPTQEANIPMQAPRYAPTNPVVQGLRHQLESGEWSDAWRAIRATTDWEERAFYVDKLAEWPNRLRPPFFDAAIAADPSDAIGYLMRGAHGVLWAWEARGSGTADTVGDDAADVFHRRLVGAIADLDKAAELDEADPTAHAWALGAMRGLGASRAEISARFDAVTDRDPLNRAAYGSMLQATAAKWGGSHEEMFAFARRASELAPDGHGLHTVIASAHIERWLYFLMCEDKEGSKRWYKQPEVHEELVTAAKKSVLHRDYVETRSTTRDRNTWALTLWFLSEYPLAFQMFRRLDGVVTEMPWAYLDDPLRIYAFAVKTTEEALLGEE